MPNANQEETRHEKPMSVPIIICDDSGVARKLVARALPPGWDVEITYATNGREGIEAVAAGKGDVLFLDLTMPEMDGFDVLEYIRANDLQTVPIVISGDIQPESYNRVMALGAVAFIKKPVHSAELCKILDDYGVLDVLTGADVNATTPSATTEESVDFSDWCQEISNVAMGRAADLLSKMINDTVQLSIPKVSTLKASDLNMMLHAVGSDSRVFAINQGFIGKGVSGETMIIFEQKDIEKIALLMGSKGNINQEATHELAIDMANILVGAFLKGFSDQLEISLNQGCPEIYLNQEGDNLPVHKKADGVLAIEQSYTLGADLIHCDQLIFFTLASQHELKLKIDYAMGTI